MQKLRLVILSLFYSISIFAQNHKGYKFEHITADEGLSQSFVSQITQDTSGFIWFGTARGINRFDGNSLKVYDNGDDTTQIDNHNVRKFYVDSKGTFWVGTLNDVGLYDPIKDKFTRLRYITNQDVTFRFVKNIVEYRDGNVLLLTYYRLCLFNKKQNKIIVLNNGTIAGKPIDLFNDITVSSSGTIYMIDHSTVYKYDLETKNISPVIDISHSIFNFSKKEIFDATVKIYVDVNENIWVGTRLGSIYKYSPPDTTLEKIYSSKNSTCNFINKCADSSIFVSLDYVGLLKINISNNKITHIYDNTDAKRKLGNNKIWSAFLDKQNILWIGHNHLGVSFTYYSQNTFEGINFLKNKNNIFPVVSSILRTKNDEIWIGTDGGGIIIYDKELSEKKRFVHDEKNDNSLSHNAVLSLYEDSRNVIWVGTYRGGLSRYIPEKDNFKKYTHNDSDSNSISANDIRKITEDSKGNLWLITHGMGISSFNPTTEKFTNYNDLEPNEVNNLWTYDLTFDKNGKLWFSTTNGAVCLDTATRKIKNYKYIDDKNQKKVSSEIYTCLADSKGRLWFSNNNGLVRYNFEKDILQKVDAFPNRQVASIEEDIYGNLWLGTDNGLYNYNPISQNCLHYIKQDGLQSNEFVYNSSFMFNGKEMFFGLINGFNTLNVDNIFVNSIPPTLKITKIEVSGKELPFSRYYNNDTVTFNPTDNFISFDFTALNYINPKKNKYKYILEGLETTWHGPTDKRSASYTSLPAGNYCFVVKAANNDGIWNSKGIRFRFTILPYWWATWWFKTIVFSFVLLVIVAFHFLRTNAIKRQNIILEKKVKHRTIDLQKANADLEEMNVEARAQNDLLLEKQAEIEYQHENLKNQKDELATQAEEIKVVNEQLKKKQHEIEESFHYAHYIQDFITPDSSILNVNFSESFLLNIPRNIISGDFFWAKNCKNFTIFSVTDCTGHGVPGAMLSMLGMSLLEEIAKDTELIENMRPNAILEHLRIAIKSRLKHKQKALNSKEGMDIAICIFNKDTHELAYAGANNPIMLVTKNGVKHLKPTKNPIGVYHKETDFMSASLKLNEGDIIYLFSDGYSDQINAKTHKKLKLKYFKELLLKTSAYKLETQKEELLSFFANWKGTYDQIDDVMVLGIRV